MDFPARLNSRMNGCVARKMTGWRVFVGQAAAAVMLLFNVDALAAGHANNA
jgi:hypothetical protein